MILIRLDVTNDIGTGHFRRSCNLVKAFEKETFIFLIKTDDKKNTIFEGYHVYFTSDLNEESDFFMIIREKRVNAIILDFLKYKPFYIDNIKNLTGLPLITFHEYEDYSASSDLIINYNLYQTTKSKKCKKILLGHKYIIFDDEIKKYKHLKSKNYIFVSFGGSDPNLFTNLFIENIVYKLPNTFFCIHRGLFSKKNLSYSNLNNVKFISYSDPFFSYMSQAKKVIVAGGNMMYEAIYLGKKPIVVAHNYHQEKFARMSESKKIVYYLGRVKNVNFSALLKTIECEKGIYNNLENKIDNLGKTRIIREIEKLL